MGWGGAECAGMKGPQSAIHGSWMEFSWSAVVSVQHFFNVNCYQNQYALSDVSEF